MCGIAGILAADRGQEARVRAMTRALVHRGPDDEGVWSEGPVTLGSRRLSILDLSNAGHQPMRSADGSAALVLNGEIYDYLELREELGGQWRTGTDTEVVLRAFERWGDDALDRLNGQFALAHWDGRRKRLLLARDRFGEKPLYYTLQDGALWFASEVKAFAAGGLVIESDETTWAEYLTHGRYDHGERTFFSGIRQLLPGHLLVAEGGRLQTRRWYDLARAAGSTLDVRSPDDVAREVRSLVTDAIRLRFRADVPVGFCLSGGIDSSVLFAAAHALHGSHAQLRAYHYATGTDYDETPWVRDLLAETDYELRVATLRPEEVPALAADVAYHQEAPFGGLPTIANAKMYDLARRDGTIVLLGGDALDEQWAGYDYYDRAIADPRAPVPTGGPVQASRSAPTRPEALSARSRAPPPEAPPAPFPDAIRNWRLNDIERAKIPRALRFGDRASSMHSTELRAPFLDHRLVELSMRQPAQNLVRDGARKWMIRRAFADVLPARLAAAPKRPVQTPQREWLRGELRPWVETCLATPAVRTSGWFDDDALDASWKSYLTGDADNSFPVWQWVSVALNAQVLQRFREAAAKWGG